MRRKRSKGSFRGRPVYAKKVINGKEGKKANFKQVNSQKPGKCNNPRDPEVVSIGRSNQNDADKEKIKQRQGRRKKGGETQPDFLKKQKTDATWGTLCRTILLVTIQKKTGKMKGDVTEKINVERRRKKEPEGGQEVRVCRTKSRLRVASENT